MEGFYQITRGLIESTEEISEYFENDGFEKKISDYIWDKMVESSNQRHKEWMAKQNQNLQKDINPE